MRFTALLILFTALSNYAIAEQSLSLQRAVEMMNATNNRIKATEYQTLAAKRERQAAISLFSPQINIRSAWVHTQKDVAIDINPLKGALNSLDLGSLLNLDWRYTLQPRTFGFVGADITVPIFTGGKIISAVKAATIAEQIAHSQSRVTYQSTFTQLIEHYFALSLAQSAVKVRQKVVVGMEKHCEDVEQLIAQGMATKADALYIKYRLSEAKQDLLAAKASLTLAHHALSSSIGLDSITKLSTPIFYNTIIEDLEYFEQLAEQNNTQLAQIESQRHLAKVNIDIHRAEFFPEIVAMGGGGFTRNVTDILPRWAIGIGANFTLFNGLKREYQYSAAKNRYKSVIAIQEEAKSEVKLLINSLYNKVITSLNRIITLQKSIDFNSEILLLKQAAFTEGAATSTEVIDATIALAAAQIEQLECAYNFDLNLAKLLEAAGVSERFFQYSDSHTKAQLIYE